MALFSSFFSIGEIMSSSSQSSSISSVSSLGSSSVSYDQPSTFSTSYSSSSVSSSSSSAFAPTPLYLEQDFLYDFSTPTILSAFSYNHSISSSSSSSTASSPTSLLQMFTNLELPYAERKNIFFQLMENKNKDQIAEHLAIFAKTNPAETVDLFITACKKYSLNSKQIKTVGESLFIKEKIDQKVEETLIAIGKRFYATEHPIKAVFGSLFFFSADSNSFYLKYAQDRISKKEKEQIELEEILHLITEYHEFLNKNGYSVIQEECSKITLQLRKVESLFSETIEKIKKAQKEIEEINYRIRDSKLQFKTLSIASELREIHIAEPNSKKVITALNASENSQQALLVEKNIRDIEKQNELKSISDKIARDVKVLEEDMKIEKKLKESLDDLYKNLCSLIDKHYENRKLLRINHPYLTFLS